MLFAEALPTDLVKMLPDGTATIAVIAVVMLFLKQQDKATALLKEYTDSFQEAIANMAASHKSALDEMMRRESENRIHYQTQVQSLMDSQLEVTKEVTASIEKLASAVNELRRSNEPVKKTPS